jgi:hypothetical protein
VLEAADFFAWAELLALACFCEDFFWFAFGDLSPMVVVLWLGLFAVARPSGHASTRAVFHLRASMSNGDFIGLRKCEGSDQKISFPAAMGISAAGHWSAIS